MNLVIGASGIVGSHLVLELLLNNQKVMAAKQSSSDLSKVKELFAYYGSESEKLFDTIQWIDIDLKDVFSIEAALEGISTVYHCAGLVSFNPADNKRLKVINEIGTKNVVDACLYKQISSFCYVSSIATINNSDYLLPLTEEVFWKRSGSESDYALSKYGAEREVWRGIEEGLNTVIVNPGIVLSPVFWNQSSARIFETCYKGNRFYTKGLSAYVAASDLAKIMQVLVDKQLYGNRFIVVENNYSFKHILSTIQRNFEVPIPSMQVSPFFLKVARFFEYSLTFFTGKERKLSAALVNSLYSSQNYSNQKIKRAIEFEFKSIDKIIAEICRYYRLQKNEKPTSL